MMDAGGTIGATFVEWLVKLGVPSSAAAVAILVVPKAWAWVSQKLGAAQQKSNLEQAGINGVGQVVDLMNAQLRDLRGQLKEMQDKLDAMESTLQTAVMDAARAKSDAFTKGLRIERLEDQIRRLGATPVE